MYLYRRSQLIKKHSSEENESKKKVHLVVFYSTGIGGAELVLPADEEVAGGRIAGPLVAALRRRSVPLQS